MLTPSIEKMVESVHGAAAVISNGDTSGAIVWLNDKFRAIFALGPESIEGRSWRTLLRKDDPADREFMRFIQAALDEGNAATVLYRGQVAGESDDPTLLKLSPLATMPGQSPLWLLHAPNGVGGRTSDHAALEAETLHVILRSTLDPIVTTNLMGQVLDASDSIERVLGWTPADLIGRNIGVLISPPHDARHDEYLARYRATGLTNILGRTREVAALHHDGHEVPVEISVSRVDLPDDRESLLIGIIHDITDRIDAERELATYREHLESLVEERTTELEASQAQLRQADRLASMGTLAAGVGHDLGNILLPMRCRLESIPVGDLTAESRTHLEAMRQPINYLQQLADGLHLLALDPHDRDATGHRTNIPNWWDQVGLLLTKSLAPDVQVTVSLPDDLPEVAAPPHRLTQSMLNLIVNSGEALGERGSIRIFAEHDDWSECVRLVVQDDGSGMTPEVTKQALDPFFTTKKRGLGTGLGLTLVHGMVRAVGGTIDIASTAGQGTTVTLHVPVAPTASPSTSAAGNGGLRAACLSVEDPRISALIRAMLTDAGYDVRAGVEERPEPGSLWISDAQRTSAAEVNDLRERTNCTVVLLDAKGPAWRATGAHLVSDSEDYEELRKTLGEAAASQSGGAS